MSKHHHGTLQGIIYEFCSMTIEVQCFVHLLLRSDITHESLFLGAVLRTLPLHRACLHNLPPKCLVQFPLLCSCFVHPRTACAPPLCTDARAELDNRGNKIAKFSASILVPVCVRPCHDRAHCIATHSTDVAVDGNCIKLWLLYLM